MPNVILPRSLAERIGGRRGVVVEASTVGATLRLLEERYPALARWLLDERGRLREHVKIFVAETPAELATPVSEEDKLYIVQAISGGSMAPASEAAAAADVELLVGTHKGLFVLRGTASGTMEIATREFAGQVVEFATFDPRSGTYYASVTHGQYGPHLYYAGNPTGDWQQAAGPAFPEKTDATVERTWVIEPGEQEDEMWAGVAPAALFRSVDQGRSWELNSGLWEEPTRADWQGGMGGLCLHSICTWPGDPSRLSVAISAAGVWITSDGGASWERGGKGLIPRYLPEEVRENALMLCVHDMKRARLQPETMYIQFHGGVYRSDDSGKNWMEVSSNTGLPADFGFPLVVDPHDPDRAFVIPLVADVDRITPEGRLRVYETFDRGTTWVSRSQGLPAENAYLTILRQAFCCDGRRPLGLYFGATSGALFGSSDGGDHWTTLASFLPPVLSVRCGA